MSSSKQQCICAAAPKEWRCFHCDEVLRTEGDARLHFGNTHGSEPACLIKAPGEFALLTVLRNAEDDLARHRAEDSDVLRAMSSMQADHAEALRREEEKGYSRGLADAKEHPETLGLQRASEPPPESRCPNCEKNEVGTFTADDWFLYGVEKQFRLVAKDVLFFRCMACDLEFTGEDGEQKRLQAVRDHLLAPPADPPPGSCLGCAKGWEFDSEVGAHQDPSSPATLKCTAAEPPAALAWMRDALLAIHAATGADGVYENRALFNVALEGLRGQDIPMPAEDHRGIVR